MAADIGTDHALLPMYLVREGVCPRVIATEAKEGPLRMAGANLASFPGRERIELRQGDGLRVLRPGEADVLVLAGMGGATIRSILSAAPAVLAVGPLLVMQPMNGERGLRQWLYEQGWHITGERLVCERGRFYVMILAAPGRRPMPDLLSLTVGPRLLEDGDLLLAAYLTLLVERLTLLAGRLASAPAPVPGAPEVDTLLRKIRGVLACLSWEKI